MMYNACMPLLHYADPQGPRLGFVLDDEVAPLDPAVIGHAHGVQTVLARGSEALAELAAHAAAHAERVPLAALHVLTPVPCPSKVIGIGLNYADHIAESGVETPEVPAVFAKFTNSVC